MATFNKDIPTRDPNYIGYSREFSNPSVSTSVPGAPGISRSSPDLSADSSGATLLKSIGDTLGGVIKAADTVTKQVIDADVSGQVEQLKDDYTSTLQQYLNENQITGVPGAGVAEDSELEFSSQNRKVPAEVEKVGERAELLGAARANGKISQTDFYARLSNMAKELRSKYPGYKDYVDQKVNSVTGFNPANAHIRSLVQDINTQMTAAQRTQKDERSLATWYIKKYPGLYSPEVVDGFLKGTIPPNAIVGIGHPEAKRDLIVDQATRDVKARDLYRANDKLKAVDTINLTAPVQAHTDFENFKLNTLGSGETVGEFLTKVRSGKATATSEDWINMGATVQEMRRLAAAKLYKQYADMGYIKVLGSAKALQDMVNENLFVYDQVLEAIQGKNIPAAEYAMNMNKARIDDATNEIYSHKELKDAMKFMKVFDTISPQYGVKFFERFVLPSDVPEKLKGFMENRAARVVTQDGIDDIRNHPSPYTMRQAIQEMKNVANIKDQKTYSAFIDHIVSPLTDPQADDNLKIRTAKGVYDPQSWGTISNFRHESQRLPDGTFAKGQYAAYRQLTKDEIVDEMWRLRSKDPQTWTNFKSWTLHSFGNELMKQEIKLLNDLPNRPGMRIGWDSDSAKFRMYLGKEDVTDRDLSQFPADPAIKDAYRVMHRVNWGLDPIRAIAKKEGSDVDETMIKVLMDHGFDPVEAARIGYSDGTPSRSGGLDLQGKKTPVTIPEQILKSVVDARAKNLIKQRAKPAKGFE